MIKDDCIVILRNAPVQVRFTGFTSDTFTLQRNGWEIAIDEQIDEYSYGKLLRLVARHEKAGLYAISNVIKLDYRTIMSDPYNFVNYFKEIGFDICHISPKMELQVVGDIGNTNPFKFKAIDATPYYEKININRFNLDDMNIFQPLNSIVEYCLDKATIDELINEANKRMVPKMKEIRAKKRKQAMRDKHEMNVGNDNLIDEYDSKKDIKAQLVLIS